MNITSPIYWLWWTLAWYIKSAVLVSSIICILSAPDISKIIVDLQHRVLSITYWLKYGIFLDFYFPSVPVSHYSIKKVLKFLKKYSIRSILGGSSEWCHLWHHWDLYLCRCFQSFDYPLCSLYFWIWFWILHKQLSEFTLGDISLYRNFNCVFHEHYISIQPEYTLFEIGYLEECYHQGYPYYFVVTYT